VHSAVAGLPPVRAITPRPKTPSRLLKNFFARLEAIAWACGIRLDQLEIWCANEARVGQKNKITRRWARRGSGPPAPRVQRTAPTDIFGAICPYDGSDPAPYGNPAQVTHRDGWH
jgi:hypothetical protein